ncbi:hypothetical protein AV540_19950 [Brevibacillus parabrevis]|uniref:PD40 domain-containing protein n=1 Tax=Brevibacillus parabrevis TaxID=54914 RepID=UPI0007AC2B34|nr:PD40 domain-containing protein [Brevibacillus parabrevis]KZE47375.1 hypothetical protein AV540_19950 [Brevibacillus parabrevis]
MRGKWRKAAAVLTVLGMLSAAGGQAMAQEQVKLPERVNKEVSVPAHVAFTSNQHLFLLDGQDKSKAPKQITNDGLAEIAGWSADGKWLLFVKYKGNDNYTTPGFLWAVRADGSKAVQIDDRAITGKPKWSPKNNLVAYTVNVGTPEQPRTLFSIKEVGETGEVLATSETPAAFFDFAWMPDGDTILTSWEAGKNRPMKLVLQNLAGKPVAAYPIAEEPHVEDGIYALAATNMKVSPDGQLVAYYVRYNAASLSADGVPIQLFNLKQPAKKPLELGSGLAYSQWLAWTTNSQQLAFIDGNDRMATENKHLKLSNRDGKVVSASPADSVDTYPVWMQKPPYTLFFSRGKATTYAFDPKKVMVPGQRIWTREASGAEQPLTKGSLLTADYYPSPSPDGKQILFLRLASAEHGSLFLQADGKETELVKGITGDIGYYANYLPEWIAVYWNS